MLQQGSQRRRGRPSYVQAAQRIGRWQPANRWTQVFDATADELPTTAGFHQMGLGLDYWLTPAVAVMAAFEINRDDRDVPNRFIVHRSFGF